MDFKLMQNEEQNYYKIKTSNQEQTQQNNFVATPRDTQKLLLAMRLKIAPGLGRLGIKLQSVLG